MCTSPIHTLRAAHENARRCTTSSLLCYLSLAYPKYAIAFQFLISLDFSSHYMHMYRYVALQEHAVTAFTEYVT